MNLETLINKLQQRIDKLYQAHSPGEYIYPLEAQRDKLIASACHICSLHPAVTAGMCKSCKEEASRK